MITIKVDVDAARLLERTGPKGEKRFVYAVAQSLNDTALLGQAAVRDQAPQDITIRQPEFIRREIAKVQFASVPKGLAYAEIYVGQKPRLLLSDLVMGGTKKPAKGRHAVAVPLTGGPARPSFGQRVPAALRFSALRLSKTRPRTISAGPQASRQRKRTRPARGGVRYGQLGTYQIPGVGVFQQQPGQEKGRLVYPFVVRPHLNKDLHWYETVDRAVRHHFPQRLAARTKAALEYHGGR